MRSKKPKHVHQSDQMTHTGYGVVCSICGATYMPPAPGKVEMSEELTALRKLVDEQAEDEGLWFIAVTAPEAYLQQELRRLHEAVERAIPTADKGKQC